MSDGDDNDNDNDESGDCASPSTHLVVVKSNIVELHSLQADGLVLLEELSINGKISTMNKFVPKNGTKELLLFTTERHRLVEAVAALASRQDFLS